MKLLVMDGNSIVNRAFYAIKLLSTKNGQFTNGICGFMNILIKLRNEYEPDAIAVAFDVKAPTFRKEMYSEYKAGRKGMPDELRSQMPILKKLLTLLGITVVEKEGFEADDILGTLSAQCRGDDFCYIATGDRDSLQLISDNASVLLASTKLGKAITTVYDKEKLFEEYGVSPKGMIEIKALMGDSSDNIPGVPGVGQKTAGELIKNYGSIDYIYENLESLDIKKGVHDKLLLGKDSAYLSHKLGTICLDAPINKNLSDYLLKPADKKEAIKLLVSLEMFAYIEKLSLTVDDNIAFEEETKAEEDNKLPLIYERDLTGLLGKLKDEKEISFTCNFSEGKIERMFIALKKEVFCVESNCFDFDFFLTEFLNRDNLKITDNSKDFYKCMFKKNIHLKDDIFDVTLASYVLNPSSGSYETKILFEENSLQKIFVDCDERDKDFAEKSVMLLPLKETLLEKIHENNQDELLFEIELPLAKVLAEMENTGFLVDEKGIADFGEKMSEKAKALSEKIFELSGEEFNINSPKQLGEVLFEKLKLPSKKKNSRGYSTSADVLEGLADEYPIVKYILEYRATAKLKSTYCDGLLKVIESDGRIRSTLNQTETRTGRISSADPNLQNIPVRSEEGREMRKFFVAEKGKILVDADYSQIELRVLAALSGDEAMIKAFNDNEDIHAITASEVFDMPIHMVTPLMRSRAKAVNFGIVYGIGAFSLSKDIGVSRSEADNYIKGYLHHYSGVDKYLTYLVDSAYDKGFGETYFHRRRYIPELSSGNKNLRAFGERAAKNMPVQGTAADIIKIAMIKVSERLKKENVNGKLIMQVHDELIVECDENEKEKVFEILREEMEGAVKLKVQLLCDVHSGKTWFEAK